MRLLLFGDGKWAAESLASLLSGGHDVLAVVGRNCPSDESLAERASEARIPVRTWKNVNHTRCLEWIRSVNPDLNISVSFDQILKSDLLNTAPLGFINCHAGKLPYYRGRNVINWAIINNEKEVGITVHYVDEGIDTGDIVLQKAVPVLWEDVYGDVLAKVETAIPPLVMEAVRRIELGIAERRPQSHRDGTYFSRRRSGDEWIDWSADSLTIYNKIRAISHPGPGAMTSLNGEPLILWRAQYDPLWPRYIATPGEIVGVEPEGVRVKTADSTILLTRVDHEGQETTPQRPVFRIGVRFQANRSWPVLDALALSRAA